MQLLLPSVITTAASHAVVTCDWAQSTPHVVLKQVHLADKTESHNDHREIGPNLALSISRSLVS